MVPKMLNTKVSGRSGSLRGLMALVSWYVQLIDGQLGGLGYVNFQATLKSRCPSNQA